MTAPQLTEAVQQRLAALRVKLAARTDGDKAKPGFTANVEAIKTEIARLEAGGAL